MTTKQKAISARQRIAVVVAGHVDHGKSTLIGRLLADTHNLPKGKLEAMQERCKRDAIPLEYAHLLDALKDEQSRAMTIDTARCFFRTRARDYLIIDVPGHAELLKNLVSGAARADAAILVVDAKEGMHGNARRHGYMLSMLGVSQLAVCINKMDLVNYSQAVFNRVSRECMNFLGQIGLKPIGTAPICALHGNNVVARCKRMPWYSGATALDLLKRFKVNRPAEHQPLRLPVQDVYPAGSGRAGRDIIVGRIETGTIRVGDKILLSPSGRRAVVRSIEIFGKRSPRAVNAAQSIGLTLTSPISVERGEWISRADQLAPNVGSRFRADLFWLGPWSATAGKPFTLKLATSQAPVFIERIIKALDASTLEVRRHCKSIRSREAAECVLRTDRPVTFDRYEDIAGTSRFVLVSGYSIAGGGIIREWLGDCRPPSA